MRTDPFLGGSLKVLPALSDGLNFFNIFGFFRHNSLFPLLVLYKPSNNLRVYLFYLRPVGR